MTSWNVTANFDENTLHSKRLIWVNRTTSEHTLNSFAETSMNHDVGEVYKKLTNDLACISHCICSLLY